MSHWKPEADASRATSGGETCRVLIVEDDADTRDNLADILEMDGYAVTMAATASEALAPRDWNDISIVILDRRLPDGDANDILPEMMELAPHVSVIIVTGFGDLEGAVSALRHGAADYILKPVNAGALRATLARLAEKQRLESALRKSQVEVREERDFVENLLETVPSFVLLFDTAGTLIRANSQWQELTGYSPPYTEGLNSFNALANGATPSAGDSMLGRILDGERLSGMVTQLNARDGRSIELRWAAKLLRGDDRRPAAIIVSGQDITELNEAQRRALQSERLAAIGHAMAGLVHESRNAIQRLSACAEMLSLEIGDRPEALKLLERIQNAQSDLHQLFEEVREYAAPIRLNCQPTSLCKIWRATWQDLAHVVREKGIRLGEDFGEDFGEDPSEADSQCVADPFTLRQVFRNLFENAVHAAPAGSEVTVRFRELRRDGRCELQVAVYDQGEGIPPAIRAKALEPFFTTKTKGTGLGLAISQRILHAHGGTLSIGNPAHGAEIIFEIPRNLS